MKKILAVLVLIIVLMFYFGFLQYKEIGVVKVTGYIVKEEDLVKMLKNNDSKETIELTKVKENDIIYKQGSKYFVGEDNKKQINLDYPIISKDKSRIFYTSENNKLINANYEKSDSISNVVMASKNIYNTVNYEKIDNEAYNFIMLSDSVLVNSFDLEIKTETNLYNIPLYSIINFEKDKIKYYELEKNEFVLKEIEDVDLNSKLKIGEDITYEDFLNKLNPEVEEFIIEEEEEIEKVEPVIPDAEDKEEIDVPVVKLSNISPGVYSVGAFLSIEDNNKKIKNYPTIEIILDDKVYLKKTFYEPGDIELSGLLPNTTFKLVGSYIYVNKNNKLVKKTFVNETFTTKDVEGLNAIELDYKIDEIFSNKIVLNNLKIVNDKIDEVLKGIKSVIIKIDENEYNLSQFNVTTLKNCEEIIYESSNNLTSNSKYKGTIEIYDVADNKLEVKNGEFEIKTSKEAPQVEVELIHKDLTILELSVNVINKDDVLLDNFRYELYDMYQNLVAKGDVESDLIKIINLDANSVYELKLYGDYDLKDGKGNQLNQLLKEVRVSTEPISALGLIRLNFKQKEITNNKAVYELNIDDKSTNKKLIDLLDRVEIYLDGEKRLVINEYNEVTFDNLESNTTYNVSINTIVKQGEKEFVLKALSNLVNIKTLKDDATVQIVNAFTNSSMIDFDVRINDIDGAINSKRVLMEVRNSFDKLILMEELDINADYKRITLTKLDKDEKYTFKFIAEEYNVGDTNLTYEPSKVLKSITYVTEEGVIGSLELNSILSQITSTNLFNINNQKKWKKDGDSKIDSLSVSSNVVKFSASNGYANYNYYLPEYKGKKVKIRFKARYAKGSNNQPCYILLNNGTNHLSGLTESYKEYTYEVTMNNYYIGFRVNETANLNLTTSLEVKDLYIAEADKFEEKYEAYSEKKQYKAEINTIVNDTREEITNNEYYIKLIKNGEEEEFTYSLNDEHSITTVNNFQLDKNSKYDLVLLFKIRDRYYELDRIKVTTEDEIRGIRTNDDFYNIHPYGNYIVVSDLDLRKDNKKHDKYYGTIDFQGHSVYTDNKYGQSRMFRVLETSAIIKNIDIHAEFLVQEEWRSMLTETSYTIFYSKKYI